TQISGENGTQMAGWPLQTMNLIADQALVTRVLTAGRKKNDPWQRTCIILRPFQAVTNFAQDYSRGESAGQLVLRKYREAVRNTENLTQAEKLFWETFRAESDPYVKMLDNVFYGSFFMGAVPRLDIEKYLPRLEMMVTSRTAEESGDPWPD